MPSCPDANLTTTSGRSRSDCVRACPDYLLVRIDNVCSYQGILVMIDDRFSYRPITKNAAGVIVLCSQKKQLVRLFLVESRWTAGVGDWCDARLGRQCDLVVNGRAPCRFIWLRPRGRPRTCSLSSGFLCERLRALLLEVGL